MKKITGMLFCPLLFPAFAFTRQADGSYGLTGSVVDSQTNKLQLDKSGIQLMKE